MGCHNYLRTDILSQSGVHLANLCPAPCISVRLIAMKVHTVEAFNNNCVFRGDGSDSILQDNFQHQLALYSITDRSKTYIVPVPRKISATAKGQTL